MKMKLLCVIVTAALLAACDKPATESAAPATAATAPAEAAVAPVDAGSTHDQDVKTWRETRVANLTRPDGWLSLVGLHWLGDGDHSLRPRKAISGRTYAQNLAEAAEAVQEFVAKAARR